MNRKIRQVSFTEALALAEKDVKVYAFNSKIAKPTITNITTIALGKLICTGDYVFFIYEEE